MPKRLASKTSTQLGDSYSRRGSTHGVSRSMGVYCILRGSMQRVGPGMVSPSYAVLGVPFSIQPLRSACECWCAFAWMPTACRLYMAARA